MSEKPGSEPYSLNKKPEPVLLPIFYELNEVERTKREFKIVRIASAFSSLVNPSLIKLKIKGISHRLSELPWSNNCCVPSILPVLNGIIYYGYAISL